MTVPELDADDYWNAIYAVQTIIRQRSGWRPSCVPCWIRQAAKSGSVDHLGPELLVRYAIIGGGEPDGYIPQHLDVGLKCGRCQYHQQHGFRLDDDEFDRLTELFPDDGRFDTAAMSPADERNERLRALGYLD